MNTVRWIRIAPTGNIPPREGRAVLIGDREIALFNLGDEFFATDNQCPHKGGPAVGARARAGTRRESHDDFQSVQPARSGRFT